MRCHLSRETAEFVEHRGMRARVDYGPATDTLLVNVTPSIFMTVTQAVLGIGGGSCAVDFCLLSTKNDLSN